MPELISGKVLHYFALFSRPAYHHSIIIIIHLEYTIIYIAEGKCYYKYLFTSKIYTLMVSNQGFRFSIIYKGLSLPVHGDH